MKKRLKSVAEIKRDIAAVLYWPGGSGGGGNQRRVKQRAPVVRPHKRTSPSCRLCSQFHTTAEHAMHAAATRESDPTARVGKARAAVTRPGPSHRASSALGTVRGAIAQVGPRGRYGRDLVFISTLWRRVRGELGMSLAEFKKWLVDQNREGTLWLVRADLVDAMNAKQVEESEINDLGSDFHFVVDSSKR